MNLQLLDPFDQDYPDCIESVLSDCEAICTRFNRGGSLLAAGSQKGECYVWDFDTRGVARRLNGHVGKVSSISWSRNGRYLLTSSNDWTCIYWDLLSGHRQETVRFASPVLISQMHPRNNSQFVAVAYLEKPVLIDISSGVAERYILPTEMEANHADGAKGGGGPGAPQTQNHATVACFDRRGTRILIGTAKGYLSILSTATRTVQWMSRITTAAIKHIRFSRKGDHFVVNANDRIIRTFYLEEVNDAEPILQNKFQDLVNRCQWNQCCFSSDGDYVIGGSANKAQHNVYVWEHAAGNLVKILEGPKEGLEDMDWHPIRPIIATVSGWKGLVYIWATRYQENWSAFAPDFKELEENVEYEEREDEFDVVAEEETAKRKQDEEDMEVDVVTVDGAPGVGFESDEEDGLFFIPTRPEEDGEEQQPSVQSESFVREEIEADCT